MSLGSVSQPILHEHQSFRPRLPLTQWRTAWGDDLAWALPDCNDRTWAVVEVPHNWEDYHGYHAVSHGNLHGTAWYRTDFKWNGANQEERLYAFFEGVGSYATVYCNGLMVGEHAGGRTTFTVDLTPSLRTGENVIAVRAHHPEKIDDLAFVCGGCWGSPNTEGSQPVGLFRPAWLEPTGPIRVEPFGLHVVTPEVSPACAQIELRVELHYGGERAQEAILKTEVTDPEGRLVSQLESIVKLEAGSKKQVVHVPPQIKNPLLWGPGHPHLYIATATVEAAGRTSHCTQTTFGLRSIVWPPIIAPNADRNVVSPDRRGKLISPGSHLRTPENNGLTEILHRSPSSPLCLSPMGAIIRTSTEWALTVDLTFTGIPGTEADLFCEIQNEGGTVFLHQHRSHLRLEKDELRHLWEAPPLYDPRLWSSSDPYLHALTIEIRSPEGTLWERTVTYFGIRSTAETLNLSRPVFGKGETPSATATLSSDEKVLRLNGEPLFLNGTCEYETLLGQDHAFSDAQVEADVAMMLAAGFNAFRDAHHPHNLRFYDHWDRHGIVCWTQMGSHVGFDNARFRENYRRSVIEWVRERRNHPCVILWGLQNESSLSEDFARELRDIIRELDPAGAAWRPTVTCNGGKGSDWNVPQEWSGTYGGNCNDYDLELLQLVGEYGSWRRFGVHTETAYLGDENDKSESWACYSMETKIRKGEEARHRSVGHFHWVFNTFPNPGRTADTYEGPGDGEIGSVNNKGLVTAWRQPSDLYYLFRANYADPLREPMVYIVSHTWPERWAKPGPHTIQVFSNCEEVELFNGFNARSLGVRNNPGRGRHFVWEGVEPATAVLHAVGRREGREVACDLIVLNHLPTDSSIAAWIGAPSAQNVPSESALVRVSCGDETDWNDTTGCTWHADRSWTDAAKWGVTSWGNRFANVRDDVASRGFTMTPVRGTSLSPLYRTYRYGRSDLKYHFRTGPGLYRLRLHFTEPWFGVGGGLICRGWRLFDIAVNGRTLIQDFDIWKEAAGDHRALTRDFEVRISEEILTLGFPFVRVNQALLCGIELFDLDHPNRTL